MTLPVVRHRLRAFVIAYLAFSGIYLSAGHLYLGQTHLLQPTALDLAIPFLPSTIWVYLTQYALIPSSILLFGDDRKRSRTLYAMAAGTLASWPLMLLYPIRIERVAAPDSGLTGALWSYLYAVDVQANCFPSLHVLLAVLAGSAMVPEGGIWRVVGVLWPLAIASSTLTTKQHYAVDVVAGVVVAAVSWFGVRRFVQLREGP